MNIACILAYSGTRYFGFQKTEMGPSIQQELEKALETILRHPVQVQAASRTDRGVHAEGQVINFLTDQSWDLELLKKRLRSLLPNDISPLEMKQAQDDFHPTLSNKGKEYHYWICNQMVQLPFHLEFSWHFHSPLNLGLMRQAADRLTGRHDFSSFTSQSYENPVRTVEAIEIIEHPENRLQIIVKGDNFLYKMVRTLVGTLVYAGCGKIEIDTLAKLLEGGGRTQAGMTAPAHGLSLRKVFY